MLKLWIRMQVWLAAERGQNITEYALVTALIAIALIGTLGLLKDKIISFINTNIISHL